MCVYMCVCVRVCLVERTCVGGGRTSSGQKTRIGIVSMLQILNSRPSSLIARVSR